MTMATTARFVPPLKAKSISHELTADQTKAIKAKAVAKALSERGNDKEWVDSSWTASAILASPPLHQPC